MLCCWLLESLNLQIKATGYLIIRDYIAKLDLLHCCCVEKKVKYWKGKSLAVI
uniref:Uncharacterized protein n=1 Tax=Arion vulgaris TaxID=1028688 RepID=A0A0B6ZPA9_9EUPU